MTIIRPATSEDVDAVFSLTRQAFNISRQHQEDRRDKLKLDQIHVLERDGTLLATARAIPFGHFFGGRVVRGSGISAVAVAAQARGGGHGRALMTEVLRGLRDGGDVISSLYPATVPIYRSLGYGYGGIRTEWTAKLEDLPAERGPAIEPFGDEAIAELDEVYRSIAVATNGLVARDAWWWRENVIDAGSKEDRYRYLVREDGSVTGWIIYTLGKTKDDWRSTLQCRDLFFTTRGAALTLLSLAALSRSTSAKMSWTGPVSEPLGDLTREDVIENEHTFRFMIRLLDVPGAFEARGYATGVETEVTLAVDDPLFDENAGPWRVAVGGGTAKVAPADQADARADVQTWASIWSGLRDPRSAARAGLLTASDDALAALTLMFAGPTPWIADFY